MSKFKLQGVGIDLTNLTYDPGFADENDELFKYVFTSFSNDYLVKNYIQSLPESSLIVKLDYLDSVDLGLRIHLKNLERQVADLVLVSSKADWENHHTALQVIKTSGIARHFGVYDPETVEELEKIVEIAAKDEIKIEYVSLPVCPLDFYFEILEYCKSNKIDIIGHNIFGGYISAARNIQAFSVPYLLGFAANYSDVILLSSRDMVTAKEDAIYLKGIKPTMEADPGYILKKSTHREVKELKRAIYTSIGIGNKTIPYTDQELTPSFEDFRFKIGSELSVIQAQKIPEVPEGIIEEVMHLLSILYYPTDALPENIFTIMRNKVTEVLKSRFIGYDISYVKLGNTILLINLTKPDEVVGSFLWQKIKPGETKAFFLAMGPGLQKEFIFEEAIDTVEETEDEEPAVIDETAIEEVEKP